MSSSSRSPAIAARGLSPSRTRLLASSQDAELFLLGARDAADLRRQVDDLLAFAGRLSLAELADLAAAPGRIARGRAYRPRGGRGRRPAELAARLESLRTLARSRRRDDRDRSIRRPASSSARASAAPRIGFLFPGQGSPATLDGGAWAAGSRRWGTSISRPGLPEAGRSALDRRGPAGDRRRVAGGARLARAIWASRPRSPSATAWAS